MRFKWAIVAALWCGLVGATPAQSQSPVTPTKAVVTLDTTVSGAQSYVVQVEFSPAPDNWPVDGRGSKGNVGASFERVDAPSSAKYNWNNWNSSFWAKPEPINNKQSIYKLTVPISESVIPGEYKLVAVTIGNDHPEPIPFSENVSIKIPELHLTTAHFNHPDSIEATGKPDRFSISVHLHMEDVSKNCVVRISPHITRPDGNPVEVNWQDIHSAEQTLEFEIEIKADAPSGTWKVDLNNQADAPDDRHAECRWPALAPDSQHFSFKVVRNRNIVIPTSVKVTISPSQIQLLRGEIDRLRAQANDLPDHLKPSDQAVLSSTLQAVTDELARTKIKYVELEKNAEFLSKIDKFFDNIGIEYKDTNAKLDKGVAQGGKPRLVQANQVGTLVDTAVRFVKAAINHNADAYELVADAEELTFDLNVSSVPKPGATIAYKLWGDRDEDYIEVNGETPITIYNLARAVYFVRIRLKNYVEKNGVRFDAIKEKSGEMTIKLEPIKQQPRP
jgi:hypothetical protein